MKTALQYLAPPPPHGAAPGQTQRHDVYIGSFCSSSSPAAFLRWLRAELDAFGITSFLSDRTSCADAVAHSAARAALDFASIGIVLVTTGSLSNPYSVEEIGLFSERKSLLPIFFGLRAEGCIAAGRRGEVWRAYGGLEEDWEAAVGDLCSLDRKLEVDKRNWRHCVTEAVAMVGRLLGRGGVAERQKRWKDMQAGEIPFHRGDFFVGRERELAELETMLFGDLDAGDVPGGDRRKRKDTLQDRGGRGLACVCGDSGIGKTEMVLEFARRFSQMYKMVLWVGGDARHIRQGFARLLPILGVDMHLEDGGHANRKDEVVNFKDLEEEIVERLRKEFSQGIPFLLVVDNLESEKDWWEGRSIMEFLPHSGSATHAIVTTKLPQIAGLEPLRLLPLPHSDAMRLIGGGWGNPCVVWVNALENFIERLGGITLGISIVRAILEEVPISPGKLLDVVSGMPHREITWTQEDDPVLKNNPLFLQLLDACLLIFDLADRHAKLASRMVLASCWFARSSVPVPLLSLAAILVPENCGDGMLCRWLRRVARTWDKSHASKVTQEASSVLVAFQLARRCKTEGYLQFHNLVRSYARKRGDSKEALSMVRAINVKGSLPNHSEHLWAACFLLFKFGTEPPIIHLKVPELLSFIKRVVIPLALEASKVFCHYKAAIVLLGQSSEMLETLEEIYVSEAQRELERVSCCGAPISKNSTTFDPFIYQDFALLRATLLEMRAMIMLKGGCYDIAQQLCRSTISIREVFYGQEHPATVSIRETMEKALGSY